MPKTKTKTTKSKPEKNQSITWTAIERPPAKRWWWYLALILLASWIAVLCLLLEAWTACAVTIVCTAAILVVYRAKPREVTATLDDQKLTLNGRVFAFDDFRGFEVDSKEAIHLVPRKVFRFPVQVPLSGGERWDAEILARLERHLLATPEAKNIYDAIARWLRLG